MNAIAYTKTGPISDSDALVAIKSPLPDLGPRDLLVAVKGISVNPVDVKLRALVAPENGPRVLGFDAAGTVVAIGADVTGYAIGDDVFYAGDVTRPGTNAAQHVVDERIVGTKPKSLDYASAASLPLTSITAWEILFDCFKLTEGAGAGDSILIIGAAGGVGSILTQLAAKLTGLTVIATASRPETADWVKKMGADHVISHREPLMDQIKALGLEPRYVASLTGTDGHFQAIIDLIKPRGHIALIDDPKGVDFSMIKLKALTLSWEFMFTRSMFQTEDIEDQRTLLNRVSALVDANVLMSTMTAHLGPMNVETLTHAHALQESGAVIGKNVLGGF